MNARVAIITAVAERDLAADALATAEAAHAMAVAEAAAADKRIADIVETEQREAGGLAKRIRTAVSIGATLEHRSSSSASAMRGEVEAHSRAAHAAEALLAAEHTTAKERLAAAQHDVALATLAACDEVAAALVDRMWEAYQILHRGQMLLADLQNAAVTGMPQPADLGVMGERTVPNRQLALDDRGRKLLKIDFGPATFRTSSVRNEAARRWHDWRKRLVDDPDAPPPWGGQ